MNFSERNEIRVPNVASWIANIMFAFLENEVHTGQGKVESREAVSSTVHIAACYS